MNISNSFKLQLLLQGLFVVFLWSASKIAIKLGLNEVSPYGLMAIVQTVAAIAIALSFAVSKRNNIPALSKTDILLSVISGVVTFAGANLFVTVGLQYVSGAMAGLVASTTSVFGLGLAYLLLREKPKTIQFWGICLLILGAYVFLFQDVLAGHFIGIGLLLVAEMAFAFGNVINRMVALRNDEQVAGVVNLIGNVVGAMVLIPSALVQGEVNRIVHLPVWVWGVLVALGLVYAWSGVLWGSLLDKLRVVEVSVLANTMIIQVAVLSVVFLGERLTGANLIGGILVIAGALVVDGMVLGGRMGGTTPPKSSGRSPVATS